MRFTFINVENHSCRIVQGAESHTALQHTKEWNLLKTLFGCYDERFFFLVIYPLCTDDIRGIQSPPIAETVKLQEIFAVNTTALWIQYKALILPVVISPFVRPFAPVKEFMFPHARQYITGSSSVPPHHCTNSSRCRPSHIPSTMASPHIPCSSSGHLHHT